MSLLHALIRLHAAACVFSADQSDAEPLCGNVQPITKEEGDELNAALQQAFDAMKEAVK